VAALPRILNELKARGYHIVHVVPATPDRPATPTEPQQWLLHPPTEDVAISHWPKIPNFAFAGADMLPAPALSGVDWLARQPIAFAEPFDHTRRLARGIPLSQEAPWPPSSLPLESAAITLPAPAQSLFEMPAGLRAALAVSSRRAELAESSVSETRAKVGSAVAGGSRRIGRGKLHAGHGQAHALQRDQRRSAPRVAWRGTRTVASGHRGPLKHLVQVKKRNV
jgi:peptidoglycan-N-acetylglucosamine deacetylase